MSMERLGTLLLVWAHPDDDIYTSAGVMAAAARAGDRVVDVTATRGEGGSMDEERWPPATMGDVRTGELLRSLEILGVGEHHFLDGPVDLDMDAHLDEAGADQVKAIMADVAPDTVITFGPGRHDRPPGTQGRQPLDDRCVRRGGGTGCAAPVRDPYARVGDGMGPEARAVQHLPPRHAAADADRRARAPLRRCRPICAT